MNIKKRLIRYIEIICLISIVTVILSGCSDNDILDLKSETSYKELLNDPDHDPVGQKISLYEYPDPGDPNSVYPGEILVWTALPDISAYAEDRRDNELIYIYYCVDDDNIVSIADYDFDGIVDYIYRS